MPWIWCVVRQRLPTNEHLDRKEVFENGNPSKKITVDDKELENAILKGVEDAKAWAAAAASHIKDSLSKNPLKGRTVKAALEPLVGKDDYSKAAGDVKCKLLPRQHHVSSSSSVTL